MSDELELNVDFEKEQEVDGFVMNVPNAVIETDAPVGDPVKEPQTFVRPEVTVTAMQYSSTTEADLFVEWGENAIRFDNPFLTIFTRWGQITCDPGQVVVKEADGNFLVISAEDLEKDYIRAEEEE